MLQNCVYGCGVFMYRFGGLGSFVIFPSICDVQSYIGCCCRYVLHATVEGLIVTIIVYMIRERGVGYYVVVCGCISMGVRVMFVHVGGAYFEKVVQMFWRGVDILAEI